MKMELYHGAVAGTNLSIGNIDPLKYSSNRTPLPAFTLGEEGVARQYAETGGVGQQKAKAGPLYKVGLEFDSPQRIRKADDLASNEFIDFMRSSLPEEGMPNYSSEAMRNIQSKKTVRFRDIFDENIKNLKPEERTIHGVMESLNDVHEFYRPLEKYDYLPRGQASIEARRFGIDALTWNDWGDDVVALLDPDDIRSNVGRKNISSIELINPGSNAPDINPTISTPKEPVKPTVSDNTPSSSGRPSVKTWKNMSPEELLEKHKALVSRLQDPAYASIDPSSVKSGSPMHMATRGTLEALEKHMDDIGLQYEPSAGRILPIPGTTASPPKPIGKPVTSIGQGATTPVQTAETVTKSGNATPKAKVVSSAPKASPVSQSSGAPVRATSKTRGMADNLSASVAKGIKGSRNLKMLGVASVVGLAGFGAASSRRTQQDNVDRRLEMQRRGIIK